MERISKLTFKQFASGSDAGLKLSDIIALNYAKGQYRKYLKLTDEQVLDIVKLKDYEGRPGIFMFRGNNIRVTIEAVMLEAPKPVGPYLSYPFQFRLNYADGKKRENNGFWTTSIDKLSW